MIAAEGSLVDGDIIPKVEFYRMAQLLVLQFPHFAGENGLDRICPVSDHKDPMSPLSRGGSEAQGPTIASTTMPFIVDRRSGTFDNAS